MKRMLAATLIALSGCATAVSDSLERRGVDARMTLVQRVTDVRTDTVRTKSAFDEAQSALSAVQGLDGAPLARQLDLARATGQNAAVAAQDLRLSVEDAKAAASRFFIKEEAELALMRPDGESYLAAEAALDAVKAASRNFEAAYDASKLRLSTALSLHNAEVTTLRRAATSGVAADARATERANALAAIDDANAALSILLEETDGYLAALK